MSAEDGLSAAVVTEWSQLRDRTPTEAVNLLVKKVKRVGHGFRNFENYRLRLLLHCGVQWRGCCMVEQHWLTLAA